MLTTLQQQLDIPRDLAAAMGRQAVAIQESGYYHTSAGRRVDISIAMTTAVQGTVTYPPEMGLPISAAGTYDTVVEIANASTLSAGKSLIEQGYITRRFSIWPRPPHRAAGSWLGARAQEEYLARSSSLYCLPDWQPHVRGRFLPQPFYADLCHLLPRCGCLPR